jgi:hypothetical protein
MLVLLHMMAGAGIHAECVRRPRHQEREGAEERRYADVGSVEEHHWNLEGRAATPQARGASLPTTEKIASFLARDYP